MSKNAGIIQETANDEETVIPYHTVANDDGSVSLVPGMIVGVAINNVRSLVNAVAIKM